MIKKFGFRCLLNVEFIYCSDQVQYGNMAVSRKRPKTWRDDARYDVNSFGLSREDAHIAQLRNKQVGKEIKEQCCVAILSLPWQIRLLLMVFELSYCYAFEIF